MQKTTTALWLLALFLLPGGLAGEALVLVDDREEPLGAPVEVCFVRGMRTECVEVGPEAGRVELRELDLLRIEGPGHGPVTVRARDLPDPEEGEARLAVPRKATLRVRGATDQRLTAALLSTEDLDPTRPDHSLAVPPGGELKVPAGDWLLALESRGAAPDLHELAAPPGSSHSVGYRPRPGWSLVVRAVAKEDETPVIGARVAVRVPRPAGAVRPDGDLVEEEEEKPPRTAQTGAAGLALFPGLEDPLVKAEVRHPDLVRTTLPGISSTPGVLEVREAVLVAGARLEAEIRVDGEPAAGWRCAVLDRTGPNFVSSREVGAVDAGDDGVCREERLPEGAFWLRVTAPESEGVAEREIRLYDGETARVTLELSPIPVEGEVRKGQEPGGGYEVRIFRVRETGSTRFVEPVAEAVTDEDGAYETTLWDEGLHSFSLHDPEGRSADSERADVQGPITRVDFRLAPGDIEGVVVDEEGDPVAGATVMVRWNVGSYHTGSVLQAGDDGTFRLAREAEAGNLEVTAQHPGYDSDTARLALVEDAVPPPMVLTLRRGGLLQGRVTTAGGAPAAGVLIMSSARGQGVSEPPATTDAEGRFEVTRSPVPPTRLYATGPGCPLMTADVPAGAPEPVVLTCAAAAGTLRLRFVDPEGQPVSGLSVTLRRSGETFPSGVLRGHLYSLGQTTASDGSGSLVLPGLSPGTYDVDLAGYSTEPVASLGNVGSVAVLPGQTQELEVVVRRR